MSSRSLEKLIAVLNEFRYLDSETPAQLMVVFLYIATHEGCLKVDMQRAIDMTGPSASRNTDWLSKYHRSNKGRGLHLINKEQDPTNRSRVLLTLTPKGRQLATKIQTILDG